MSRIIIVQPFSFLNLTGNIFYLEEIAQCLEDIYDLDVYIYNKKFRNRELLLERYTKNVKETDYLIKNDIIITDCFGLEILIKENLSFMIDDMKYIFLMNCASGYIKFNYLFSIWLKFFMYNKHKFFLLHEPPFNNGLEKHSFFKKINYSRGFYFNRYINNDIVLHKWFVYDRIEDIYMDVVNDINTMYKKIENFCMIYDLNYTNTRDSLNVASKFDGLFYLRNKDFMPRLPYEFWYYNKPVVFFDVSNGMLNRFKKEELPLSEFLIKEVPKINLDNLVDKIIE